MADEKNDGNNEAPLASAVALAQFLPNPDERRKVWADFFERREREREEVKRVRDQSKVREYRDMMGERFHVDPATIQIVSKLRSLQTKSPARCARVWYQVQVIANDLKIDVDHRNEERDDDPVFDRTTVARRQGVARGYGGTSVSENVRKTRVNRVMAEQMLENLRAGLPPRHRVGRPSNEERAAQAWAEERFDEESDVKAQQAADLKLTDQQQIEQNASRLSGGISKRAIDLGPDPDAERPDGSEG